MSFDFAGKVIVVTGGAGDIARSFSARAASAGAVLALVDRRADALQSAVDALSGLGNGVGPSRSSRAPRHSTHLCDLTDEDAVRALVDEIESTHGRIDVLVNNVGMTSSERFDRRSVDSIRQEIEVNMISPLVLTRLAVPLLQRSDDPRVATTVSLGGIFPLGETPIYTASKFGLRGAMLSIGLDLKARGITAGSVLPSATDTRMLRQEAIDGGNSLQFQDAPQPPEAVVRALVSLLDRPRLEVYPRRSESVLVRVAMLFPNALPRMMSLFRRRGERGMAAYLRQLERDGHVVRRDGVRELVETR